MRVSDSSPVIPALRATLQGRVITPNDPGYDEARTIFPGGYDFKPAIIARAANAGDVARVIAVAREGGLDLSIRSGGHTPFSSNDGGIVLDLREMKRLEIDVDERTAWAESGLTTAEYSQRVGAHGLATGFGDTGSVGIAGSTLGGGVGYLTRKYGLTVDSLLAADIITGNGDLLHVNERSHPDLFWAIRGGGGNFGVVTGFKFQLQPISDVLGGILLLSAVPEVITGVVAVADAAPEELTVVANIMPAPPIPFVPAEHHGKLVVMLMLCYAGDPAAGERVVRPLRDLTTPIADMVRGIKYPEIFFPTDPSFHPADVGRTFFLDHVDRDLAAMIVDRLEASDAPLRVAQLRVLGGAMARVPAEATAFAHRNSRIMGLVAAFYNGPQDRSVRERWVKEFANDLQPSDRGAYVSFLGDEGEARVRAAYPGATWDRLTRIKARYDPANLFRRNQNIPPAIETSM